MNVTGIILTIHTYSTKNMKKVLVGKVEKVALLAGHQRSIIKHLLDLSVAVGQTLTRIIFRVSFYDGVMSPFLSLYLNVLWNYISLENVIKHLEPSVNSALQIKKFFPLMFS